jgi:acetylornithine deacetylase/succinyl-diaminopimelate desuccinylase-like protein
LHNWNAIRDETEKILIDLIRINTANPPGNEIAAAVYLQKQLDHENIESRIYEAAPGRGSLVARIPGDGRGRPLVLLGHLDVVAADPASWSCNPFAGTTNDGYIWGRGALDMKGMLVMELMTLLLLKQRDAKLARDLIWVAAADEEAGGVFGMDFLMKQGIPGLAEAEYIINEGGEGTIRDGVPVYACQNGEKGILWIKLTVAGTPGHASMPAGDNAIARMAAIIDRLERQKKPLLLCETTRAYIRELAGLKKVKLAQSATQKEAGLRKFASRYLQEERSARAMFYNTISPTVIKAGEKVNVLPGVCEATFDCRLVPGETPEGFLGKLRAEIDDPAVEIEIIQTAQPTESPLGTKLFETMRRAVQKESPGALLAPFLSPGGTDSRYFRRLGIPAYGFIPVLISEDELQRMHGIDERLSLENLERGTRILYEVVREMTETG